MKKFVKLTLITLLTALTVLQGQALAGGTEYVDGYGRANSDQVSACLNAVGAEETDQLHDAQWEEWLSCMAKTSR